MDINFIVRDNRGHILADIMHRQVWDLSRIPGIVGELKRDFPEAVRITVDIAL